LQSAGETEFKCRRLKPEIAAFSVCSKFEEPLQSWCTGEADGEAEVETVGISDGALVGVVSSQEDRNKMSAVVGAVERSDTAAAHRVEVVI
jgi:hypothetical protein